MKADPDYRIATMTRGEVEFAIELAAKEGWNPGLADATTFHAADPDGFLVGKLGGEPIGCISAVRYPGDFGFIGLYIVVPEQRGKGYGIGLWNAAMQRLAGCNVGLDGVIEQQANYRRSGFRLAHSNLRYELADIPRAARSDDILPVGDSPVERILAYDRTAFPAPREAFLRAWLEPSAATGLLSQSGGRVRGYGAIRKSRSGWKIGPLFADDGETAERLYLALCARRDNAEPVYLDVPEVNAAAVALAQKHRMRKVFGTARMYTGVAPPIALERVFGVTTFELG